MYLGIDIGSISVNTVVMDAERDILENRYDYCHGRPFHVLKDVLENLCSSYGKESFHLIGITGTGGKKAQELIGGHFVNEIVAQSSSVAELHPEVKTIIEMGGEDSKLIYMDQKDDSHKSQLADFAMNSICAAGTGSFLDQQAKRIGVAIETEFGELALRSEKPPRIAGRCSVFAKSDMIHLQQIATPVHDIVAGLCFAVARNFKSNLARGKDLQKPVIFQGGVAANVGMVRAFREILNLDDTELLVPHYYASMGAIGALYHLFDHPPDQPSTFKGFELLNEYLIKQISDGSHLDPLKLTDAHYIKDVTACCQEAQKLPVYLGLDVGSLSTNVVLIDAQNNVIARRYLPTASKPLEAIQKGLSEIHTEVGDCVEVVGAGTTGSGRYLTGDFIGADTIQNEITAQATAAITHDPGVDTIFEIGGQDSKFISIDNGIVVDFEMNKVCAAGTGSFLEEQAEKLDINIEEEFGKIALDSSKPARLGDRCTVFMESDLNSHQQKGVPKEDLIGGLAYSIVHNYLQKVVGDKRIGNRIFFQGGVTNNKAVVAAFEKVLGKPVIVPPHYDVTGAIGAAILARDTLNGTGSTRFKGFHVSKTSYSLDKFTCGGCSNQCEIRRVRIEGEQKPLFYGGRCEKYEVEERKTKNKAIPNLFQERMELLLGDYEEDVAGKSTGTQTTIGIPRGLMIFYQQFPFWRTFFENLGFRVVVSKPSDRQLVTKSLELLAAETCFPVEVMHGHVRDLLERQVDYVFMPFIVNNEAEANNPTVNYNCPWIQTYPFMISGALRDSAEEDKLLVPTLHFRYGAKVLNPMLVRFINEKFKISKRPILEAIKKAHAAQREFQEAVELRGRDILANLSQHQIPLVIFGRPYNTSDPELNLGIVEKLINHDCLPIPVDFLPLKDENIFDDYHMICWPNGQKVLAASRIVAKSPHLHAVYLSNFRCGPDSFLSHYVREEMGGKPYLQIEVDEHSADAGMITRCEAFLDSLKSRQNQGFQTEKKRPSKSLPASVHASASTNRILYFPYMADAAYPLAAATRSCGIDAQVLPMQTEADLELGRVYTSSRECFPMICTTGSFLKKIREPGFEPKRAGFFMPDHNGPCRFGQYHKMQRIIFDRLGYEDVEIVSPSNDTSYAELAGKHGIRFRLAAWKGIVAVDLLRKLLQERRPYELGAGDTEAVYQKSLKSVEQSVERGAKDLKTVLSECVEEFRAIKIANIPKKPVIAIVGEIFMRDNPFCSGFLVQRLESLGAETIMAPVREWITYSTYRFWRDNIWKRRPLQLLRSKVQQILQHHTARGLVDVVADDAEMDKEVELHEMLNECGSYIHHDYDGDPPLALGAAVSLAEKGVSGIVNILPFTCMPGTLITSVSNVFRKDHDNIPWVNIAYDGQDDATIETRLQAFIYQAKAYSQTQGFDEPQFRLSEGL